MGRSQGLVRWRGVRLLKKSQVGLKVGLECVVLV